MTAFTSGAVYSSQQVTVPEVIADHIYELAPYETPLLMQTGLDSLPKACTDTAFKYHDQEHRPTATTLNGAIGSTTTGLTVTDAIYKQGDQIQVGTEIITLGTTADNLTFASCTRSAGAAAAASHSDGDQVVSLDKFYAQGSAMGSGDIFIQPSLRTNYTSIIKREPYCSGTANALPRYGREGTEYDYQAAYQIQVAFQILENRTLWGWDTAPSTGSTAGTSDGIYERIQSGSSTNCSSQILDFDDIRPVIRTLNKYGANPGEMLVMLVPLYTKDVIDSWGQAYVRHMEAPNAIVRSTLGTSVDVLFIGGRQILLVPYHKLESEAFLLTTSKIGVGPLVGRAMSHTFYGKEGDRLVGEVLGEYTNSVACSSAHHVFYGLKYS